MAALCDVFRTDCRRRLPVTSVTLSCWNLFQCLSLAIVYWNATKSVEDVQRTVFFNLPTAFFVYCVNIVYCCVHCLLDASRVSRPPGWMINHDRIRN